MFHHYAVGVGPEVDQIGRMPQNILQTALSAEIPLPVGGSVETYQDMDVADGGCLVASRRPEQGGTGDPKAL